jgi:hypothetical protein
MTRAKDPTSKALRTWEKNAPTHDRKIASFERGPLRGGREWIGVERLKAGTIERVHARKP